MSTKTFSVQLLLTIGLTAVVIGPMHYFIPQITPYWLLSLFSVLFFILLTVLIFAIAKQSVRNSDPNAFTRVSLLFVFVKLLASLGFIVLYDRLVMPETRWFVLPFLLIYVIFTIFEVIFMMALSREKV